MPAQQPKRGSDHDVGCRERDLYQICIWNPVPEWRLMSPPRASTLPDRAKSHVILPTESEMMTSPNPLRVFRKLALANRLANARLHRACAALPVDELTKPRPAFFGSVQATLNHILLVDRFYLNALEGHPLNRAALDEARACPDLPTLAAWQATSDTRLLAHIESISPADLAIIVAVDRGERIQHDRRDDLLSHIFQHQTHHRGQVHGMLSATAVSPPQLDEFIVGDDAAARSADMALLGWEEDRLMR